MAAKKTRARKKPTRRRRGRPSGPSKKKRAQQEELTAIAAEAPEDHLEAATWMFRALKQSAVQILRDGSLHSRDQRAELRATAKAMMGLMPLTRLHDAERAVRGAQETQERTRKDSKLSPAPEGGPGPMRLKPRK